MADLIDRAAILEEIRKIGGNPWSDWETAGVINLVYRQSIVDAVEVVRCKDCKHKMEHPTQPSATFCDVWAAFNGMGDEGFCNYGERKEE